VVLPLVLCARRRGIKYAIALGIVKGASCEKPRHANLLEWYTTAFEDQLMARPQPWFKSFLFAEGVFKLPFFFVALYGLLKKR